MPPPRFVNPALFLAIVRPVLLATLSRRNRRVLRDGRVYRPYFRMRSRFDTTHADSLLAPAGIQPPPVLDYLDTLFRYCRDTDWGRRRLPPDAG